ncbi:hypothetical protein L1887_27902 [Cichorium endivia]|nr:hypothetical protein L1887_27902 [Cichorium endivia]
MWKGGPTMMENSKGNRNREEAIIADNITHDPHVNNEICNPLVLRNFFINCSLNPFCLHCLFVRRSIRLDMDTTNWRSQLQAASRQRMVNRILDTLKKHVPLSGNEMVQELEKIAVRFEDKIYTSATSPVDYLQKISLKMQTLEERSDHHLQDPQGH